MTSLTTTPSSATITSSIRYVGFYSHQNDIEYASHYCWVDDFSLDLKIEAFEDDFNDNSKDFSKWHHIFHVPEVGKWEEVNGRAEFELPENWLQGARYEGIESVDLSVELTSDIGIIASTDVITDVYGELYSHVGLIVLEVTDGENFIRVFHDRYNHRFILEDSNGNYINIHQLL